MYAKWPSQNISVSIYELGFYSFFLRKFLSSFERIQHHQILKKEKKDLIRIHGPYKTGKFIAICGLSIQ